MALRGTDQRTKSSLKKRIREHLKEVLAEEKDEVAIRLVKAKVAEQEGFSEVAARLREIAYDEAKHAGLIAEFLYQDDIKDSKSNVKEAIDVDRYAHHRELEFLALVRQAGDAALVKLVEQLIADENAHVEKLEDLVKKLGWED